ncbi:hypothetical protein BC936DRAFT_139248 [Jimgerdemannia flammicorona]|uniref:WDHD1/CFT4 second beta-propeller domain-containing protein n=1 Tax=Jimgerdemannia flammicorona TaxID=994334 RepID=A0A433BAA6_9FUNG|nr:hypothetical protein BC936DRAFT_139248 [Jimgerdemannia flammicorona]
MVEWDNILPLESNKSLRHPAERITLTPREVGKLFDDDGTESLPAAAQRSKADSRAEGPMDHDEYSDLDDFVVDDDGAGYVAKRKDENKKSALLTTGTTYGLFINAGASTIVLQPPFQSGATPKRTDRRYLAFNLLGIVSSIDHGTHSTVSVDFHDRGSHRNYYFTDHYNYSMAYLGERGAMYAVESSAGLSKGNDEDKNGTGRNPSVLFYRPYESWTSNSEWLVHLPPGEDVRAIALNEKTAIAATSKDFIRFFSLSGVQTFLFALPGIVTISARGEIALFIYHLGPGLGDSQNFVYLLYNTETHERVQEGRLPVSNKATLAWVGFSETGLPAVYDSAGIISILHRHRHPHHAVWIPVFDAQAVSRQQGKNNDRYWAVGLMGEQLMCVVLKGGAEHPSFPKPIISEVNLQLPLLQMDSDVGKLEEMQVFFIVYTNGFGFWMLF